MGGGDSLAAADAGVRSDGEQEADVVDSHAACGEDGALVGGSVCDGAGIRFIGYVGGAIALAAVVLMINSQRRSRKMSVI